MLDNGRAQQSQEIVLAPLQALPQEPAGLFDGERLSQKGRKPGKKTRTARGVARPFQQPAAHLPGATVVQSRLWHRRPPLSERARNERMLSRLPAQGIEHLDPERSDRAWPIVINHGHTGVRIRDELPVHE
jgi:hypothetical protein